MRSILLLAVLAACPGRDVAALPPESQGVHIKNIPVSADLDVLFVIDNSASTDDKQKVFRANFQNIIDALDKYPTGRPNLHIGVVDTTVDIGATGWPGCPSPDPAEDGRLQTGSNCGVVDNFISDLAAPDGTRMTNYTGDLATTFSCMASVGSTGCGFEAPLEAMKRALDGRHPENAGFVRNGAWLAVVILTDEDDASVADPTLFALPGSRDDFRAQPLYAYGCDQPISATSPGTYTGCRVRTGSYLQDPDAYVQFLASVKDPFQTFVAVIASPPPDGFATNDSPAQYANINVDAIATGPLTFGSYTQPLALQPSTTCTIGGQTAIGRPALRLASFLGNYGDQGRFYNVCQPDYSAALTNLSQTLIIDTDPCLAGDVQVPLDCTVTDVANGIEQVIPQCTSPGTPATCWYGVQDTRMCVTPSNGWKLEIARASPPADGTVTHVECTAVVQ
jgi:hypothetical protein